MLRLETDADEVVAPVVIYGARPEAIGIELDDLLVRQIHSVGRQRDAVINVVGERSVQRLRTYCRRIVFFASDSTPVASTRRFAGFAKVVSLFGE